MQTDEGSEPVLLYQDDDYEQGYRAGGNLGVVAVLGAAAVAVVAAL